MSHNVRFYIGGSNFQDLIENDNYYVDKTKYLKDLFMGENDSHVSLFIRPRRFGKTLNMKMIEAFCKLNYNNPGDKSYQEKLFLNNSRNLTIVEDKYKDLRNKFMGEFPVIFVSLKNIEGNSYLKAMSTFLQTIANIYRNFRFLKQSTKIDISDRNAFTRYYDFCNQESLDIRQENILSTAEWIASNFIYLLAAMLYQEYNRKVLIIIDEYDVPLQKSVVAKEPYYEKMLEIIRQISINTFKEDVSNCIFKVIVTGCLKIAHQSIFTGANNFVAYGMDENPYAGFFGFTRKETEKILEYAELSDQNNTIKEWYDGYRIGDEHLFCPWSVLNFLFFARNAKLKIEPQPYWINTSGNDIINLYLKRIISGDLYGDFERLKNLLNGIPQDIVLKEFDTYPDIRNREVRFESLMTLLLQTGYLTFTDLSTFHGNVSLKIPNVEIFKCFELKLQEFYKNPDQSWTVKGKKLLKSFMTNDIDTATIIIGELLDRFISLRETGYEFFYQGFMHGILTMVAPLENIIVTAESECGDGYADITLYDEDSRTSVILEFKKSANNSAARTQAANRAADQIIRLRYAQQFIEKYCQKIYGMGIGFGGKLCVIKSLGNLAELPTK